ncbi:hypothetical protein B4U78_008815 [Microbacterium esteraromaticum]|jgi:hypothetical protein|nr:hypothetical protein B4U78_008815 [Microbacterium esteraromaticum]
MSYSPPFTIACDESGAEGENLMASNHPVFVHGSVNVGLEEANELAAWMKAETGSQASEIKSKTMLSLGNRGALFDLLRRLDGRANMYFVEKSYFVTAKMVSLFIAWPALLNGEDIAADGSGRELTDRLHSKAPKALGIDRWNALLHSCNQLLRSYLREGTVRPTTAPFLAALDDARVHCADVDVRVILESMWMARDLAEEYQSAGRVALRELDPMAGSLVAVAMTWALRLNDAPFEFLIDRYSLLTEEGLTAIADATREDLSLGGFDFPRADLRALRMTDSRLDARVQIADIIAGVGREVARLAMTGDFDNQLIGATFQMLDFNPMCSTGSALDRLTELRPLQYLPDHMRYPTS